MWQDDWRGREEVPPRRDVGRDEWAMRSDSLLNDMRAWQTEDDGMVARAWPQRPGPPCSGDLLQDCAKSMVCDTQLWDDQG